MAIHQCLHTGITMIATLAYPMNPTFFFNSVTNSICYNVSNICSGLELEIPLSSLFPLCHKVPLICSNLLPLILNS